MPKPFFYKTKGEALNLNVTVVDEHDLGHPVISIGGFHVAVPRESLDQADTREHGREETDEERDLREIKEKQQA